MACWVVILVYLNHLEVYWGKESVEEEGSEETEVTASLAGATEASEAPNLALSNQPLVSKAEKNFQKTMEQMNQFMVNLTQVVTPRDSSRDPEFNTPYIKAPDSFDGTQAHKLRRFIQSCQLIFHESQRTSSLIGRRLFNHLLFSLVDLEN
ncbi:hypothetical protein O181_034934 [Austropuccinia psidii MF-1]|uniref:Uncharacterized protein n=1 Tax=Austropuccinia psidii MF-1 TaxID=1389203 RepID=A0A9Q3HA19_9BASI|nr:hypothetical protein [Austropuccinia psidii MF-1]